MANMQITQDLLDMVESKNATLSIDGVKINSPITVTYNNYLEINANSGFKFESVPVMVYRYQNVQTRRRDFEDMNAEMNYARFLILYTAQEVYNDIEFETVEALPPVYNISADDVSLLNSTGTSMQVSGIEVSEGSPLIEGDLVTAISAPGKNFEQVQFIGQDPVYGSFAQALFTLSNDNKSAELIVDPLEFNEFSQLSITVVDEPEPEPEPRLTFTQAKIDELAASNVEMSVNGVVAVDGTNVYLGDILTASTVGNFAFGSIELRMQDMDGAYDNIAFTVNEPPTTATLNFGDGWSNTNWGENLPSPSSFTFYVVAIPHTPEVVGVNRVYKVSGQIINEINDVRFQQSGDNVIDYGDYILGLIQLPFEIDPAKLGEVGNIQLGNFDTQIEAESITVDKLSVDLGTITVPETEYNLLDFANVVCNLHLPLTQSVVVDANYVIGETLGIEYLINLYSGEATINLTSTKVNGDVFFSKQTTLGVNVPYIRTGSAANIDNVNLTVGGDNHIKTPFIEVVKNEAVLPYGFFTSPIVDEGVLLNESGYVVVENIDLKVAAISNEKEAIIRALSSGVIIK